METIFDGQICRLSGRRKRVLYLKSIDPTKTKVETLVIPVCEDRDIHDIEAISLAVKTAKKIKEFKGEKGDELTLYNHLKMKAMRMIFLGIGKYKKIDSEALRRLGGRAVKKSIKMNLSEILVVVPSERKTKKKMTMLLEALLEGAFLGNHLFDKYKKEKKHKQLKKIDFLVKPDAVKAFRQLLLRTVAVCEGTLLAREWVSMPSNDKRPEQFIRSITARARKENLKVSLLDEKRLKRQKFGALLAVGAGSQSQSGMVVIEYAPKGAKKTVALIGKGVTFDSGGISLKPAASMDDMKSDMSGAAAVAATLIALAKLKPKMRVIGTIPVVENMPSGTATRPGDIVRSFDGKTVEIGNTDAEGRLILIDAISYTIKKYQPDTLIDVATLTGACIVALGDKIAGVFSTDDKLAKDIVRSGEKTHERCWQMPLLDDYKESLKSDFADIRNISSTQWGGAITAALFLSEFAGDSRWAHIDIAGPAFIKNETEYCGAGGTGFGVRLFCDLLDKL